jgi:hypothetical protein
MAPRQLSVKRLVTLRERERVGCRTRPSYSYSKSKGFLGDCELMWREIVWASTISAMLATEYLKPNGVFVLSGDAQAFGATPETIAYGMAKAAVL